MWWMLLEKMMCLDHVLHRQCRSLESSHDISRMMADRQRDRESSITVAASTLISLNLTALLLLWELCVSVCGSAGYKSFHVHLFYQILDVLHPLRCCSS